jgi:glyoxylase-like metal-dependent hydrolase (beta-lactamase superfamily II)
MSETAQVGEEAEFSPPVITGPPVEIEDGVFLIPDRGVELVPNVGVIVGERAALVVDSGLGPKNGQLVRELADEIAEGRPLFLTLTHFHPEHGFGAQAFADQTIVYNRVQHEELQQKGPGYQGMFSGMGDLIAQELADVQFVSPHVAFDGEADLDLGGRTVQLRTFGPGHTRGDEVVYLPAEKIAFIGDLIECRSFPILSFFPPLDAEVDARQWLAVLAQIRAMDIDTIVPGHGEPGDKSIIDRSEEYLGLVLAETNRLADAGESPEQIAATVVPDLLARFPEWDPLPEFLLAAGVQSVLANRD